MVEGPDLSYAVDGSPAGCRREELMMVSSHDDDGSVTV